MTRQIDLWKKGPSKEIWRIDWAAGIRDERKVWTFEQKLRRAAQVELGDSKNTQRTFRTPALAQAALAQLVKAQLRKGFAYEDEPPPAPVAKPSKPWRTAPRPAWLAKLPDALEQELREILERMVAADLGHRRADVMSLMRPTIHLRLKPVAAGAVRGIGTRFGGDPHLPATLPWPMNGRTPLAFVAQYRLEELARFDLERKLPRRGLLSVFAHLADGDDYGQLAKACYFPDARVLVRRAPAHGADVDRRPDRVAIATPVVRITVPGREELAAARLRFTSEERARYHDEVWLPTRVHRDTPRQPGAHQLLGWGNGTSPHALRKGWELLAQIDSDGRFGFQLGDVETLRVHVATAKLAAADVRDVRASFAEA